MKELLICTLFFLAAWANNAFGLSSLCPPRNRRLALTQPSASPPVANSVSLVESFSPSESPQPSPSGGKKWNKAKTGGVAAGGSIAAVGALLIISKFVGGVGQAGQAGKHFLKTAWANFNTLRESTNSRDASRYPVFDGEDATKFLQDYERFARQHKMRGNLLNHVEVYLDPRMREWYHSKLASGEIANWKVFVDEFHKEFGREETYEYVIEELEAFQQGKDETVEDYTRRAQDYVSRLDRVNPCQRQEDQISNNEKYVQMRFLKGLRPGVREKVRAGVKGLNAVSWDFLQAVAKAVSFNSAENVKAVSSVVNATEHLLGEVRAQNLTQECLHEAQESTRQSEAKMERPSIELLEATAEIEKLSSAIDLLRSQIMQVQQ